MIELNITDETSQLNTVVLGIPQNFGGTPKIAEAYDPKSKQHIIGGTFPKQHDIIKEMNEFSEVLIKHDVKVLRPVDISELNQVFARDIGFVIDDKFVIPNILSNRAEEIGGINFIIDEIPSENKISVPKDARIEGGDVIPWKGNLFVGYSKKEDFDKYTVARTNEAGIDFLRCKLSNFYIFPIEHILIRITRCIISEFPYTQSIFAYNISSVELF